MTNRTNDTVVVVHAHPDDEAIFTGGTLLRLAEAGMRTVVVFATDGSFEPGDATAQVRRNEARMACDRLDVSRVEFLGYGDSGIRAESKDELALHRADSAAVSSRLAELIGDERATALVTYDEGGIYGHPDHLVVHRAGLHAAALADLPTVYESTVDREYLHFVETHLVGNAVNSLIGVDHDRLNAAPLGVPTVLVTTTIDVRAQCSIKRLAMADHASQVPHDSPTLTMDDETFQGAYGFEWYIRRGPPGPLETLAY